MLGSSVAVGEQCVEDALKLRDDGVTLGEALETIGFRGEGRLNAVKWDSWVEVHIEQSTKLTETEVPIGVVTDITGTTRCQIEISGEANHTGTTSMSDRTDALTAASEIVLAVESIANEIVEEVSETAVATIGKVTVSPNCTNVVPGTVTLGVDIRDVEYNVMVQIVSELQDRLDRLVTDRNVTTDFERSYSIEPVSMDANCIEAFQQAAARTDYDTIELHSGAGHDTMTIARVTDAGMIFAPSRGGHSYSPQEWTDWADCAAATRVLTETIYDLSAP